MIDRILRSVLEITSEYDLEKNTTDPYNLYYESIGISIILTENIKFEKPENT